MRNFQTFLLFCHLSLIIMNDLLFLNKSEAYMIGHNPYTRSEMLDPQGRFRVEWTVDTEEQKILFNLTVSTIHWVGFGLSKDGTMNGADMVIGGVTANGKAYFSDRHSVGNNLPEVDSRQDWTLHEAWETGTQTFLSFSRALDTCDNQDFPITADRVSLIWSYGESDSEILTESGYHHQHKGFYDVYLLDPHHSPYIIRSQGIPKVIGRESSEMKLWSISTRVEVANQQSEQILCTMHKAPRLSQKHHLVGFGVQFITEESKKLLNSVHLYRCNTPRGNPSQRSMFELFLKSESQSCPVIQKPEGDMPTNYCTELVHEWHQGGNTYFTPSDVGYPFGLTPDEFYMVQAHYNSAVKNEIENGVAEFEIELYYTSKLRLNEAGIMVIGHEVPGMTPSLLIPPSSSHHMIFGHCGGECTKLMFPASGIRIYATSLHSHSSGRKLKLQHFRNNRELSWVSSDDNYDSSFQQIRILQEPVKVLPGDHLIMRCVYNTKSRNGTVVGGYFSQQEQCTAYVHYYNRISDFTSCTSEIISEDYRKRFLGVTNVTWVDSRQEFVVENDNLEKQEGMSISEVSDNHVLWEPEMEAEFQRFHRYHPQINKCYKEIYAREDQVELEQDGTTTTSSSLSSMSKNGYSGSTAYPFTAKEYQPEQSCSLVNGA